MKIASMGETFFICYKKNEKYDGKDLLKFTEVNSLMPCPSRVQNNL